MKCIVLAAVVSVLLASVLGQEIKSARMEVSMQLVCFFIKNYSIDRRICKFMISCRLRHGEISSMVQINYRQYL